MYSRYAERVPGTGKLLDTLHGVNIGVFTTGHFSGNDKPKPIAFPDPATIALRGERFSLLPMTRFIELKLASGMVAAHPAKEAPQPTSTNGPQTAASGN